MSLIITSNIGLADNPETSDVFKPYSYQNALSNTLRIPADSEIALQSAKIVKNHLLVIDRTNSGYCHYFGTPIGEDAGQIPDIASSTTTPFFALGGVGAAFDGGQRNQRNTEDFANDLQASIKEVAYHPSLVGVNSDPLKNTEPDASIDVDPLFDPASGAFSGYKWSATQSTTTETLTIDNTKFSNISAFPESSFPFTTDGAGEVSSVTSKGFSVRYDHKPISQNSGEVIFDFSAANADQANSPFMCGLTRINTRKNISPTKSMVAPETFNVGRNAGATPHFQRGGNFMFADICILRAGGSLYVYQSGTNSGGNDSSGNLCMNEITYYGAHNANFADRYNIKENDDDYVKVKFVLENEHISIFLGDDGGSYTLLCDFLTLHAAGATKNKVVNPTNCAKWAMYPIAAANLLTAGDKVKTITLDSVISYTAYPVFDATKYHNYQWWGHLEKQGDTRWATDVEKRFWNDKAKTVGGVGNDGLLDPQVKNAGKGMKGYSNTLILSKSQAYGPQITEQCNSQQTLGFMGKPVSSPESTSTDVITNIQSEVVPQLTSGASLFIRLNNFTQMSINARQGTVSKIIGHLPRFDNGGNETGALYFEPHEKTYIDLNNPEELLVNSFDVDVVYDNETFCTALNGKTIVCFHIRKKLR
tara:strand:- start:646 stop:2586 length:1941 start_codon:yes stop_codon:yes gene_type:complete